MFVIFGVTGLGCHRAHHPESQVYIISEDARGVGASLGTGGSGARDCDAEHIECWDRCWHTTPPYPHTKGDGWHYEYCTRTCREEYNECAKEQEQREKERAHQLKFSHMDEALDWLGNHKAEIALGTVVIVAGVAFIIATSGAGALILVPLAL